jgi:hypothetical protein
LCSPSRRRPRRPKAVPPILLLALLVFSVPAMADTRCACFGARWKGTVTSDTGALGTFRARGRNIYFCHHVSGGAYNGRYRCVGPGCPARNGEFGVNLGLETPSGPGNLDGLFSRGREKLPSCLFRHKVVTGSVYSLDVDARWTCYVFDGHGGSTAVSSGTLRLHSTDNICTACGCAKTPKRRTAYCRRFAGYCSGSPSGALLGVQQESDSAYDD